jgi:hypothetical protein
MPDETVIAVSDIHGHAETAGAFLEAVSDYADEELDGPLLSYDDGWSWEGGTEYTLVFDGDMIDRGPDSDGALEMVFDLQDEAPDGQVRYLMGNHETFALFPDVYEDLYLHHVYDTADELEERSAHDWYDLDEDLRGEMIERVADGRIEAGYEGPGYDYLHAGADEEQDITELNEALLEAGDVLEDGYDAFTETGNRDLYREAQEEIMFFDDGDLAVEDRYKDIFRSDEVRGPDAGVLLMDFEHMTDDAPAQIVGHTTGTALADTDGFDDRNPQRKGEAVNINTMRDHKAGRGPLAASVETDEGLEVVLWDGQSIETEQI